MAIHLTLHNVFAIVLVMKQKFIDLYMDWASRVSKLSHARRLQVGAVIVKDDSVISYGYNGMPANWDNNCENIVGYNMGEPMLKTKPEVLHAESNAIAKLAKSSNSGNGADLFVTHSPCLECAKLIHQSGISRVWYSENYRDDAGIKFLVMSQVEVRQIDK
ncbi:ComEB Deoxycytidylate deaminase [uncultured Caudovirales phage]|uniref:ComEB Deoxycytidylate deaminase n=1 Tax=uncultured Caudovirales phage TaxID=2100421 RepID=A0A6J5SYP4_9CAUD|nr:ComEB Deoxycytidylate deaminase [uncultured Caudovirales phage]